MNFGKTGNINSYGGLELYLYDTEKLGSLFIANLDVSLDININTLEILESKLNVPFNILNSIYVFKFNIYEKYRGNGFGTNLLNETVKFCKIQKIEYIYLNCDLTNNKAKKLYDKFGFIEFGRNNIDYLLYYKIPPN